MPGILIYNLLIFLFLLMGLPILLPLMLLSEKRRNSIWHRLGFTRHWHEKTRVILSNPHQKPIWIHALSVGEVLSTETLLSGLKAKFPCRPLILTVSTQTGYAIAHEQLSKHVASICYAPIDLPFSVKQAIDCINPAMVLIVETDIWPNFLCNLYKRSIPVLLVNARLSERSARGYQRLSLFFRPLFSTFNRICVQSDLDGRRFTGLGIASDRIHLTGNIKFDQDHAPPSPEAMGTLKNELGVTKNQQVIVAGSTHEGEEAILLKGICQLKKQWPALMILLVPRDPKRASLVSHLAESMDLSAATLTSIKNAPPSRPLDVVVVDVIGMLRDLYALSDIAFVGGSLAPFSGHNPLEPAACGKPILFGPDMRDFLTISHALEAANGAIRVQDAEAFSRAINQLLSDPGKLKEMGRNALTVFQANGGAVEKILSVAGAYL